MSVVNKYLEETPLTSTKNKYVEGNLKHFEKNIKELVCGSYGYINLKRKAAPGAHLFIDLENSLLTSTETKFLLQNEPSKKKKKMKMKRFKQCRRVMTSDSVDNFMSCDVVHDQERSRSLSIERSRSPSNRATDLSEKVGFSFFDGDCSEASKPSFFGQSAGNKGLVLTSIPPPPGLKFPGHQGLVFGSMPPPPGLKFPGNQGLLFGSTTPPQGGLKFPVSVPFGFGAPASSNMQFLQTSAKLAKIPETIISKMPTYELNVLTIQEKVDFNVFASYPVDSSKLHEKSTINFKSKKLQFLNVVSMALMYSSNLKDSNDAYGSILKKVTNEVMSFDPEFILKVALYARQELHIRTVTNFLLSYAAVYPSTRLYLEKYFKASIVLPSDWIQVAEYYQVLIDKPDKRSLPSALRRVMKKTFAAFDEYQLAKYNKNKKKRKKIEIENLPMMVDDDDKKLAEDDAPHVKTFTLKNLIKTLHIDSPVEHVMCLLGKKYPENHESFISSGLSGNWDSTKAGKRMKLPIPETWETQIAAHGNKPTVWESLIDKNKLPYMATLRNLKNLVLSGISPKHHKKVIKYIENKNAVINSRQLPVQYYEAYKALSHLEEMVTKNKSEVDDDSVVKVVPAWKRNQIAKIKERINNVSVSVVEDYKSAITKALEISSMNNLHPIPGKTLVICEMPALQKDVKISNKAIDTCIMMGLMCFKACEECKLTVLRYSDEPDVVELDDDDTFLNTMMNTCQRYSMIHSRLSTSNYEEYADYNISALQNLLDSYLKPQKMLSLKLDHIVFMRLSSDDTSVRMKGAMSSFLQKYRQIVNSELLYTDVDYSLSSKSFLETSVSEKDVYLCGSTSSLIKFIAERSSGGQLGCVENIDQKFNLPEITESKKAGLKITPNLPIEAVIPLNLKVPKWHTVRIFISSTFKDMISERDMLIRYVFPELRKRAASIFIRIAEIDLRWGITEADSATKRAAELCLIEAQKSDLFVGFVGDRYGTIYSFDAPDASELQWVKDCPPGLSITELEMYAAALRNPESSRKKAFFYFRNNSFIRHVPEKWSNHFTTEDINSKVKVDQLKSKIKSNGFKVFDGYPCHWSGIFENKPILAGLDLLGENVLENLWEAIQHIHKEDPFENDISEEEINQQNLIDSLNFFVGKKSFPSDVIVKKIKSEHGIFVVSGGSGCGKTAFSINLLQHISNLPVVKFFIGASPRSRDLSYMIQYICHSICHQLSVSIPLPDYSDDIVNQFPDFLVETANCSGGRDVVLLIDGLDHLEPNDQRLDWLPLSLPNKIKLICSVTDSSQAFQVLCERQARGNDIFIEKVSPLQQSDREHFVRNYLDHYRKTLDESAFNNHLLKIVTKKDSVNPLYLRIVCDFLRIYASFDNLTTVLQKLPSTVTLLFQEIILQMENEFGSSLVQTVLSLLCISKLGLEDNDLRYITSFIISSSAQKTASSFDELKENILLLEPETLLTQIKYCSLMHTIIIFVYGQFRQTTITLFGTEFEYAVKKFYMNKNYVNNCKHLHSVLAAYYHCMCDTNKDGKYNGQSGFAIRALLYHLFQGCLYKELCDLLCNHQFIEAVFRTKVDDQLLEYYSSLLFDILETRQKISKEINYNNLISFYDFVSRNFHILHRYPQLVKQQALNDTSNSLVNLKSGDLDYSSLENLSRSEVLDCRLATLCGFVKNITASAGEMQKSFVILGSEDGYLKVLDLSTRKIIHTMKSHFSAISCICYAGKNRICVSSVDGTLSLWDSQDFTRVAVLKGHRHNATSCCADPSGFTLFSSGWDNSVRLWSLKDGRSISVIDDFKCPVSCIDHHPIKEQIACGLWNGNIEILDTISMKRKHVFQTVNGSVKSIAYTPDGINIIASFMQSGISILSSEEGLKMSSLKGHILPVKSLIYSYEYSIFVSGSDDCTLKVWSSVSKSIVCTIDECKFCPISLMEFISQNLLAVAFQNSEIWIVDINCGKPTAKFNLAPDIVSCFSKYSSINAENQDSVNDFFEKSFIFGSQSGKLMVGNLLSSSIAVRAEMKSKVTALLHNCEIIVCGCADGDLGIFSYSGPLLAKIVPSAHRGFITTFCITSKTDQLAVLSISNDNVLKIWNVNKSTLDASCEAEFLNKHKDTITCSAFENLSYGLCEVSDWMNYLFTGSHDNNIILWDSSEKVFQGLRSSVLNVAVLNDYVLGCGNDGAVVIWSMRGEILTSIPGIELSSATLTFHITEDDSNGFTVTLAYVDTDGSVKIAKPLERTFSCSLEGHSRPITSCCAAKNGEIISCSLDGSVNLWRMPASVLENHPLHSSAVTGIIISSSYEFVLSADVHGNLILWKIDLMSSASPLIYAAKKNYPGGFIKGLSWLKNNRFVCAVSQMVDSEEKYFLNTLSLENNSKIENASFSFRVNKSYQFESEISCFDTCSNVDVIVVGLKSGYIMVIDSEKQQLKKMCDDWILEVKLFTREKTSDFFCASFVDGKIKLFSVADFLNPKNASVSTFAVYEPPNNFDATKFSSVICCGLDRVICCGDLQGAMRVYAQHSLKFSGKVHTDSITGICVLGPYVFTSSLDKTVKGWSILSYKQVCQFYSHVPITCLAAPKINFDATLSSDHMLVLGTASGEVMLLKFHSKESFTDVPNEIFMEHV